MRYEEFVNKYCKDIIADFDSTIKDIDGLDSRFPYDEIILDGTGQEIKVVYDDKGNPINIQDIVSNYQEDFAKLYPSKEAKDLYERYMDMFIEISDYELLNLIRETMEKERQKMAEYEDVGLEDFL